MISAWLINPPEAMLSMRLRLGNNLLKIVNERKFES